MWVQACVVMLPYLFDDEIVIAFCICMGSDQRRNARLSRFAMHFMY